MKIYFSYPREWWYILAIIFGLYFLLLLSRRKIEKSEWRTQFLISFLAEIIAFIVEYVAVTFKLWGYAPGNWPIILWVAYFGIGLLSYQLAKKVEELTGK